MSAIVEPFDVVVADPPWRFGDKLPGPGRGAEKHYPTLSMVEICEFQRPPIADNAWLFLWRVAAMAEEAYTVVRAWGFVAKAELVWIKTTSGGRTHFGMGHYTRSAHETCIVAVRGRVSPACRSIRSIFSAQMPARHSGKPDAFFWTVERLVGGGLHKVELFARASRPGWTCYGNELPGGCVVTPSSGVVPESSVTPTPQQASHSSGEG